jgi:type VI secretion system protein ImpF
VTNGERGLERTARPSLLDRIVDLEPREALDRPLSQDESIARYRASVLRDVEWLLNARRTLTPIPAGLDELASSVFAYGLPDISSLAADSDEARAGLVRRIERAIRLFEPRLADVRVILADVEGSSREIHFTIEGLLRMEPEPEQVVFDTVVELARGDFSVESAS